MVRNLIVQNGKGWKLPYPASSWEDGILLGNGNMGADAWGDGEFETITLTQEHLYAPVREGLKPIPMGDCLLGIRGLLDERKYKEATDLIFDMYRKQEGLEEKIWTNPFFPAGDIHIVTKGAGCYRRFERSLSFETGEGRVRFQAEAGICERKYLVSRKENCLAVLLTSERPADYVVSLSRTPYKKNGMHVNTQLFPEDGSEPFFQGKVQERENGLWYLCRYRGKTKGYGIVLTVAAMDGRLKVKDEGLHLKGCQEVLLLASVKPSNQPYEEAEWKAEEKRLFKLGTEKGAAASYQQMYAEHAVIHQNQYDTMKLELENKHLEAIFQAGRYEIFSACGETPPNLQGIWTGTYDVPWSSDYTQNGNLQTAILALLPTGNFEGMRSYFNYEESLMEDYRTNSQVLYHCRGIHLPSRTSDCGIDFHFDKTWPMVFWTAGAAWTAHFYYDYWLYTGDDEFFVKRALPFMKEAALFYEDYLYEDETGHWKFSPSYSPENTPANSDNAACVNATMDISVATELFRNLITGCRTLGMEEENVEKWQKILDKMPPYLINEDGALKEWADFGLEDNYDHRHSSHLYLFYYDIPRKETPEILEAAKKAYEIKMERKKKEQGTMAFGLVQAGMAAAHLGDAKMADTMITSMADNNYYRTYASSHDFGPSIFNADISGGMPALMLECLVQSSPLTDENEKIAEYEIRLLPALPASMKTGKLTSVHLRGGFTADLEWKDGVLEDWKIENPLEREYHVVLPK